MRKVTFDDSARDFVLDTFDKKINQDGYVVEKNSGDIVLTPDGREVEADKLAGIIKGSEIYIKDDITSLIEASETIKDQQD